MSGHALVSRMRPHRTTIFATMSALALETGAINLGQGFPDTDGPHEILAAAQKAIDSGYNQYPPGPGHPELREAIVEHQQRFYGIEHDPAAEVLVTTGATEGVAAAILAFCESGDEVVTFEPFYDSYAATIALAGARHVTVDLALPGLGVDPEKLRGAITTRTRLILLNTPHNPTGKVFSRAELDLVASVAIENDLLVVTDEVYEHLVFAATSPGDVSGPVHIPIATLPGMAERTLTVSSIGKTFSLTGWKIGWVCGPAELVAAVRAVKQFLTFVSGGPFQPAAALALRSADRVYRDLSDSLRERRDLLCAGLEGAGFSVTPPDGTYFVTADVRPLGFSDATALAMRMPHSIGVVAIPLSGFYADTDPTKCAGRPYLRFAFCKRRDVLLEAADRLTRLASSS